VIHAFFDDSKTAGRHAGFICLAGYVALDDKWDAFTTAWDEVLVRNKLRNLHTADFCSGVGDYSGWVGDRDAVLVQLASVIKEHVICGIAVGVDRKAYDAVVSQGGGKKKSAEVFCFERLLRRTMLALQPWDDNGHGHKMALVFDDDERTSMSFYGSLRDLKFNYRELRDEVVSITFANDRFFNPLQAADLLACATQRGIVNLVTWSAEGPFLDLLSVHIRNEWWDTEEIMRRNDELASLASWPRRPH
jgi:hypothetical protein